jgi:hypothetical protein
MSPTSYQAAPPREGMIADALGFVKPDTAGGNDSLNFARRVRALPHSCVNEFSAAGLEGFLD